MKIQRVIRVNRDKERVGRGREDGWMKGRQKDEDTEERKENGDRKGRRVNRNKDRCGTEGETGRRVRRAEKMEVNGGMKKRIGEEEVRKERKGRDGRKEGMRGKEREREREEKKGWR